MGRVRTKTVKRAARALIEKHYVKLSTDFHFNKKILTDVAEVNTKRLRNKIAGYTSHLMKRIQNGPVRGISLKIQEEERERRLDFVPKVSNVDVSKKDFVIDHNVNNMLKSMGMSKLAEKGYISLKSNNNRRTN